MNIVPRIRLLIVDDNVDVIESFTALFELAGFDVATANGGSAALDRFASRPADVVLIDLGMPHMNGFELATSLRQAATASVLLIAMTGWMQPGDAVAVEAAGFDHYVTKPVDTDLLEWLIRGRVERPLEACGGLDHSLGAAGPSR